MELTVTPRTLTAGHRIWERCGLALSPADITVLERREAEALRQSGRVDFGGGILEPLALAFCDSPYIQPRDWPDTLAALTELFYALKNETRDCLEDEALLSAMVEQFNGKAGGSLDALAALPLEEFLRSPACGRWDHD